MPALTALALLKLAAWEAPPWEIHPAARILDVIDAGWGTALRWLWGVGTVPEDEYEYGGC